MSVADYINLGSITCHVMTGKHLWIYFSEEACDTNAKETKPNGPLQIHKSSRASCRDFFFFYRYKQAGTQFPQTWGCSLEPNYHFSFSRSSSLLTRSKQKCLFKKNWFIFFFPHCLPWHLKHYQQIMTSKNMDLILRVWGFLANFNRVTFDLHIVKTRNFANSKYIPFKFSESN